MAESAIERLKRLAAAKKAGEANDGKNNLDTVGNVASAVSSSTSSTGSDGETRRESVEEVQGVTGGGLQAVGVNKRDTCNTDRVNDTVDSVCDPDSLGSMVDANTAVEVLEPTPSDHPLAMQFAELEQALLTRDPSFKTILRDIHRHLGSEPELVTMMTEEEVHRVVRGLVTVAQEEIVEPAKAKAVKATTKALKAKAIDVDDL